MGVKSLWTLLEPCGRRVDIKALRNKTLAIDASGWIFRFLKAMRDERGDILPNAHTIGFMRRICKLLYLNIRPVFVFDGSTPALKKRTVAERRRRREQQDARVKRTAEKLLLNRLKQYAVRELEKTKVPLSSERENPGQETQGKASCAQQSLSKKSADATVPVKENVEENKSISIESSDDNDEQEGFEVDVESGVDPEVLSTLPPSMQLEIMLQLREKAMAAARGGFESRCKKPEEFSQYQIQQYLTSTGLRRKLDAIRGVAQQNSDIAKPVAGEQDKHYVLYRDEKHEEKSMGEGSVDPIGKVVEPTESKSLNISFCVQEDDDSDIDDIPWEDVEDETQEVEKAKSDRRSKYWSLSHGFQKGRSLGNWGEKSAAEKEISPEATVEEQGMIEQAIRNSLLEQHASSMEHSQKKGSSPLDWERGRQTRGNLNDVCPILEKQCAKEKEISVKGVAEEQAMIKDVTKKSVLEQHTSSIEISQIKKCPDHEKAIGAHSNVKPGEKPLSKALDHSRHLNDEYPSLNPSELILPRKDEEAEVFSHLKSGVLKPVSMTERPGTDRDVCELGKRDNVTVAKSTPVFEIKKGGKKCPSYAEREIETDSHATKKMNMKPEEENPVDIPSNPPKAPETVEVGEDLTQLQKTSIIRTRDETMYRENSKELGSQQEEQILAAEDTRELFDLEQLAEEEAILRSDRRAATGQSDSPTEQMFTECQELLQMFGLPYIIAPTEAEAQCAWLDANKLVDGVVTDDNDAFLFGAKRVYRHIFEENKYVEEYRSEDVERELGFSRDSLILMALLLGSDYTPGIAGVGVVNAVEIISAFTDFDGLLEFKNWVNGVDEDIVAFIREDEGQGKNQSLGTTEEFKQKHKTIRTSWILPEDFPSQEVVDSYQKPALDDSKSKFTYVSPDFEMLKSLCARRFGWDEGKINDLFEPVKKSLNQRDKQQTIQGFLTFREKFARVKSKRLAQAVEKVKSKNLKRKTCN